MGRSASGHSASGPSVGCVLHRAARYRAAKPAIALVLLALAGCSGGDGFLGTGLGGGSSSTTTSGSGGTLSGVSNYFLYGGAKPPPSIADDPNKRQINCPRVQILDGTAGMRIGDPSGSASQVAYQASLGDTARECKVEAGNVVLKVGVEGRLLIGTLGKPGNYTVPLRIVVKRNKDVLVSRLIKIQTTVPQGQDGVGFMHVEDGISVPLTENDPADEYDLLVGFDPEGKDPNARADKPARKKRKG